MTPFRVYINTLLASENPKTLFLLFDRRIVFLFFIIILLFSVFWFTAIVIREWLSVSDVKHQTVPRHLSLWNIHKTLTTTTKMAEQNQRQSKKKKKNHSFSFIFLKSIMNVYVCVLYVSFKCFAYTLIYDLIFYVVKLFMTRYIYELLMIYSWFYLWFNFDVFLIHLCHDLFIMFFLSFSYVFLNSLKTFWWYSDDFCDYYD